MRRYSPPFFTPSLHIASLNVRSVLPSIPFSSKGFFTPPWEISFSQVLGEWGGGGRPGARFCLCRDRYLPDPVCADGGGGGRKSFKRVLNGTKKEEARRMGNDGHAADDASSSKSGGGVTLREVLFQKEGGGSLWGRKVAFLLLPLIAGNMARKFFLPLFLLCIERSRGRATSAAGGALRLPAAQRFANFDRPLRFQPSSCPKLPMRWANPSHRDAQLGVIFPRPPPRLLFPRRHWAGGGRKGAKNNRRTHYG